MNFAQIQLDLLTFPATMSIDYIRVYQPKDAVNLGCDPSGFPTAQYIDTLALFILYPRMASLTAVAFISSYKDVYNNPNVSTWEHASQPWPKNRLETGGKC